jgi:RsiW-degrading membrane proteinase PrsW (M82 family)
MIDLMAKSFVSFFQNPSVWGIGLAIGFGVVWLACYWPPLFKKPWLWAVLVSSPFLTLAASSFILFPLMQAIDHFLRQWVLGYWILVVWIPLVLLGGLVQEGAKLVPVVVYWRRSEKNIDPKLGLIIGAVAGAGFAIFSAQHQHNLIFFTGWNWAWAVHTGGFWALAGFWESFFTIAAQIAFSALAGYGLARGRGWQFYLIASGLHALLNYGTVLLVALLPDLHEEIYIAAVAVAVTAWALWLRWRKTKTTAEPETSSP